MSGKNNLKVPTPEQAREYGQRGGKKKAENAANRKTFQEALKWYLEMEYNPDTDAKADLIQRFPGLTNREAIAIIAVERAAKNPDVRIMEFIRDAIEEGPKNVTPNKQDKKFGITITTVRED